MNKFISILIIFLSLFQNTFAYSPSDHDKTILNNVYQKIDKINPNVYQKLYSQINNLKSKYKNNEKVDYLLDELGKYIKSKIVTSTLYDVLEVSDGDTIKIDYNGTKTTVRLIGVDAPESFTTRFGYKECFGDEASDYLKKLLKGKKVGVELDNSQGQLDKYGRLLAYIKLDGENINAKLIQEGYAYEYTYDKAYKYQDEFKNNQYQAKNNLKGLWAKSTCNGERKDINNNTQSNTEQNNTNDIKYYDASNKNYLNMGFNCNKTMYCKYMTSCDEVKYFFYVCAAKTFDGDKDGIPCEQMCGSVVK
ncbi:MAG: thermonuclease family protein [Candidatus Gracilibacteria bacterium]|nr:thermonuclease family protein [Candidatus Gracilibacteria bacterium]